MRGGGPAFGARRWALRALVLGGALEEAAIPWSRRLEGGQLHEGQAVLLADGHVVPGWALGLAHGEDPHALAGVTVRQ